MRRCCPASEVVGVRAGAVRHAADNTKLFPRLRPALSSAPRGLREGATGRVWGCAWARVPGATRPPVRLSAQLGAAAQARGSVPTSLQRWSHTDASLHAHPPAAVRLPPPPLRGATQSCLSLPSHPP